MKKITFTINGRRFDVELDGDFALYVIEKLAQSKIDYDRNNDIPKFLNAYLQALKENYDNHNQV